MLQARACRMAGKIRVRLLRALKVATPAVPMLKAMTEQNCRVQRRAAPTTGFRPSRDAPYPMANFIAIPMVPFAKPAKFSSTLQGRKTGDAF